jgi:hypothetical protein
MASAFSDLRDTKSVTDGLPSAFSRYLPGLISDEWTPRPGGRPGVRILLIGPGRTTGIGRAPYSRSSPSREYGRWDEYCCEKCRSSSLTHRCGWTRSVCVLQIRDGHGLLTEALDQSPVPWRGRAPMTFGRDTRFEREGRVDRLTAAIATAAESVMISNSPSRYVPAGAPRRVVPGGRCAHGARRRGGPSSGQRRATRGSGAWPEGTGCDRVPEATAERFAGAEDGAAAMWARRIVVDVIDWWSARCDPGRVVEAISLPLGPVTLDQIRVGPIY